MSENVKILVVASTCIIQDGQVLLIQEGGVKAYKQWNFPAGQVEVGETIEETAVRESLEESGYEVTLDKQLPVIHTAAERPVFHTFLAHVTGGQPGPSDPGEILAVRWFAPTEIRAMASQLRSPELVLGALDHLDL